jgi:HlyD family type I secretion membrane fusion protein
VTLKETYRREAAAHLKEAESGKLKAYERMKATQFLTKAQKLTAPISGIVVNFEVSTLAAVIGAGEKIMEIVPIQQPMIISGKVNPQDIDQVFVGQTARVRFSAFSQRTTPEFSGKVTYVAADLTYDRDGEFAYYKSEILVEEESLNSLDLQPGMPAETFITIGTRSPLNYLLKPLLDNLEKAWKEPD